jgi:hypothetical protein
LRPLALRHIVLVGLAGFLYRIRCFLHFGTVAFPEVTQFLSSRNSVSIGLFTLPFCFGGLKCLIALLLLTCQLITVRLTNRYELFTRSTTVCNKFFQRGNLLIKRADTERTGNFVFNTFQASFTASLTLPHALATQLSCFSISRRRCRPASLKDFDASSMASSFSLAPQGTEYAGRFPDQGSGIADWC